MPGSEETRYIMACPKQVKSRIVAVLVVALILPLVSLCAAESAAPSARELLSLVRANQVAQNRNLNGKLRMSTSDSKIEIPFRLFLRGDTLTYQFTEFTDKPESLVLHFGEKTSRLERVTGSGDTQKITGAKLDEPVRGTGISFEDLAMKFLYWNNAVVEKETERLMTRTCWIVSATPSNKGESQYDRVRLWIEPSGALLKAECYNGGKLIRRFTVTDVQSTKEKGGGYILKSMRIERPGDRWPTKLFFTQD